MIPPEKSLPAPEGMEYQDAIKHIVKDHKVPLRTALSIGNLAVHELYGGDFKRPFDEQDVAQIAHYIKSRWDLAYRSGWRSQGANPNNAFRQIRDMGGRAQPQIHTSPARANLAERVSQCSTHLSSLVIWVKSLKCAIRRTARP
jgi:hypothetical protein